LGSFVELVKTFDDVLFFNIDFLIFDGVELLVEINERKITLWSNIHISSHLLEVNFTDFSYEIMDFTHVLFKSDFDSWSGIHAEATFLDLAAGYRDQSILWPWEEPIDRAA